MAGVDAAVTCTLLAGAFLLETASLLKAAGSTWTLQKLSRRRWSGLHYRMVLWFRWLFNAAECSRRWPGFIGAHGYLDRRFLCFSYRAYGSSLQEIEQNTKARVLDEIRSMVADCKGEEKLRTTRGGLELERLSKLLAERLSVPQREQFQQLQELIQDRIIHNDFDKSCTIWRSVTEKIHEYKWALRDDGSVCLLRATEQISSYMAYLLNKKPHMLPPPVRPEPKKYLTADQGESAICQALISCKELTKEAKLEAVLGVCQLLQPGVPH